jgi:SAM-dependent methyltransferase
MSIPSLSSQSKILLGRQRCGVLLTVRGFASTEKEKGGTGATTTSGHSELVNRMRKLVQESDSANAWDALWSQDITPWDLGGPTKALVSELERKHREAPETLQWKTALIPGCGSGYDLLSLARFWDSRPACCAVDAPCPIERTVIGLDVSPTSLERAKAYLVHARSSSIHKPLMHTDIRLFTGDFFADPSTWDLFHHEKTCNVDSVKTRGIGSISTFDFIFDYTFFCAIPPTRRQDWGRQMTRLLTTSASRDDDQTRGIWTPEDSQRRQDPRPIFAKGGQLLTLMFPYVATGRPDSPGPPYPVSFSDYVEALQVPGENRKFYNRSRKRLRLTTNLPYESIDTVPSRRGQELVGWWSFENSKAPSERRDNS